MTFEPIRSDRGQPRVRCICDDCGRDEVVPAVHGRRGHEGDGQAASKIQKMGWSYIGKRLRCPACESSRKVVKVKTKPKVAAAGSTPREPTRAQKREILDLLAYVYDIDGGCYRRGDTDETVADVLGVMPGWVSELREELFGPAGSNEDMAELRAQVDALIAAGQACIDDLQKTGLTPLSEVLAEAKGIQAKLAKIEKAVGPRVMSRAK